MSRWATVKSEYESRPTIMERVASGPGTLGSRTVQKALVAVPPRKEDGGVEWFRSRDDEVDSLSARGVGAGERRDFVEAYDSRESSES